MLEKDASIFLVNAYSVLDGCALACSVDKCSIHVMDSTLAITTQRQAVGHISSTILAKIESMFSLMRVLGIAVRNHHLRQRQSVENRPDIALVVVCDVVEHNPFLVVESNVEVPVLPINDSSVDFERDSIGLSNVDGLDIRPVSAFCLDTRCVIVVWLCFANGSADFRDIDVDDFLLLGVEDRAEIEGERVLAVVYVRPIIHQGLLQSAVASKSVVISNCPSYEGQQMRATVSSREDIRSQYTLCMSSFGIPLISHCSITFGSFRQICSTACRSSIVIWRSSLVQNPPSLNTNSPKAGHPPAPSIL